MDLFISRSDRQVYLDYGNKIGNDRENLQTNLVFKFKDEFVDGTARLEYVINGEKFYALLTKTDEAYELPVKSSMLQEEGRILMQLVITEGTDSEEIPVFKSNVFYLIVDESINAEIEASDLYPEWIDVANTKLNEIDEAITKASRIDVNATKEGKVTTITITRQDGTQEIVYVLDGEKGDAGTTTYNELTDKPKINGVELVGDISLEDLGTVKTDNNYTNADKEKLDGLENYDDTLIQQELSSISELVDAHDKDISNIGNDIDAINENIQEQDENINHLADTKQDILTAGKNVTIENNVISAIADVDIHVEDGKLVIG